MTKPYEVLWKLADKIRDNSMEDVEVYIFYVIFKMQAGEISHYHVEDNVIWCVKSPRILEYIKLFVEVKQSVSQATREEDVFLDPGYWLETVAGSYDAYRPAMEEVFEYLLEYEDLTVYSGVPLNFVRNHRYLPGYYDIFIEIFEKFMSSGFDEDDDDVLEFFADCMADPCCDMFIFNLIVDEVLDLERSVFKIVADMVLSGLGEFTWLKTCFMLQAEVITPRKVCREVVGGCRSVEKSFLLDSVIMGFS